jgi:hypothetical protein
MLTRLSFQEDLKVSSAKSEFFLGFFVNQQFAINPINLEDTLLSSAGKRKQD